MDTHKVDTDDEEWRAIEGFEGYYEVSSRGRVRSLPRAIVDKNGHKKRLPGKVLAPRKVGSRGLKYIASILSRDGRETSKYNHVLVAQAFLGHDSASERQVHHIDHDSLNNRLANLEVVTPSENVRHSVRAGRRGKLAMHVPEIRAALARGELQSSIAKRYGVCFQKISQIKTGFIHWYIK